MIDCKTRRTPILLISLGIFILQSAYAGESRNLAGAVVSVKDVATIVPGSGGAAYPAKPGESIYAKDTIKTSAAGAVKILLKDHSVVDLGAATVFRMDQYNQNNGSDREVQATLGQGSVRGAVSEKITGSGKFHLKTATATMGVRGTEFVVDQPPAKPGAPMPPTKVTVLQGQVEVAHVSMTLSPQGGGANHAPVAASKTILTSGQQVVSDTGGTSKPVTLDSGTLSKVASVSKVTDNTFSKAITIDNSSSTASSGSGSQSGNGGSRTPASGDNKSRTPASSSSGGNLAMTEVATAVAAPLAPPPPPVNITDAGISGTFNAASALHPVTSVQNGFSTLTVRIH